jgi:ABC-type transport system involved in multi-copper enzyme maturation permease subunit
MAARALPRWAGRVFAPAILAREAARTSRQWQTYAARAVFSASLLGFLLTILWIASRAPIDKSDFAWIGRGIFVAFTVVEQLLIAVLAPSMAASAITEELEDRTADVLALTRITPPEILVGKVLSRVLVLALVVLGAMPVMAVVATLGGVSGVEVLATSAHNLVTVTLLAFLGAFFALFTRSALLATVAADGIAGTMYLAAPPLYAAMAADPWAGVHLSPLLGSTAIDGWAFLPVLAYLPVIALLVRLAGRIFDLRIGRASIERAFSAQTWQARRWGVELGTVAVAALLLPFAVATCWYLRLNLGAGAGPVRAVALFLATGFLWTWWVAALYVAAWPALQLVALVVDGIDRLVSRTRSRQERMGEPKVWANPVAWYEARPDRWVQVIAPVIFVAVVAGIWIFQTGMALVPGGLVLTGAAGTTAAVLLTTWLVTGSIERERREGTLEVLFTTPVTSGAFIAGKLAGALLAGFPVLLFTAPAYVFGVVWLDAFVLQDFHWVNLAHGLAVWVWTLPLWLALVAASMAIAIRTRKLQAAFGTTLGVAIFALGTPTIIGRAFPSVPSLALPARVLVPPLAGADSAWEYGVGIALMAGLAAALLLVTTARIRSWIATGAALLLGFGATPARAAEPQDGFQLAAVPLADGMGRVGDWTGVDVALENLGAATDGTLALVSKKPSQSDAILYERAIALPEGARKDVTLIARMEAPSFGDTEVVLHTGDGREAKATVAFHPIPEGATAIAVLGDDPFGLNGILTSRREAVPALRPSAARDDPRAVRAGLVPLANAPRHAAEYAGFDWVVWMRADPARLEAPQLDALQHWVASGGHLLIELTDTAPAVRASPVAAWLPVELGDLSDVSDVDALLLALGAPPAGPVAVATPQATVRADRTSWVRAEAKGGRPLWVSSRYGLGTIHVLLADPRVAPLATVDRQTLWRALLSLEPAPPDLPAGLARALRMDDPPSGCALLPEETWQDPVDGWTSGLRSILSEIPGVSPVPMPWVLGFAALYLFVIGPLDWFALRWLGRQPLTWITFPASILVFSLIALAGTAWTKGSQAMVRRFELVDQLSGTGSWRGATYLGVFSTRKAEISITGGFADGLVTPLETPGFLSHPAVDVGEGAGKLRYHAETWSLAYVRSEWTAPSPGDVSVRRGPDGWELTNHLPFALTDAVVYQRQQPLAAVDVLPAGGSVVLAEGTPPDLDGDVRKIYGTFAEGVDLGRPHLEGAGPPGVLLATLPDAVEPLQIEGLQPVIEGRTVLRVPVEPVSTVAPQETP